MSSIFGWLWDALFGGNDESSEIYQPEEEAEFFDNTEADDILDVAIHRLGDNDNRMVKDESGEYRAMGNVSREIEPETSKDRAIMPERKDPEEKRSFLNPYTGEMEEW